MPLPIVLPHINYPSRVGAFWLCLHQECARDPTGVYLLEAMPMKDQNVLPVFTEPKNLCSDLMQPATRANRLIESKKWTFAFYYDI
jgi:hypothetical protein